MEEVREAVALPLLRKDFVVDPYQVYESRAMGASAVLLIMALLDSRTYAGLSRLAGELGLDVLVEVHDAEELKAALEQKPAAIGVNNRNLKDLTVDVEMTFDLLDKIPRGTCIVSESGIQSPATIERLRKAGVNAALIGESLLRSSDTAGLLKSFVEAGSKNI